MKLNFVWKHKRGEFQSGQLLYLGKIPVASYSYNASRTQGTKGDDWKGHVDLPGLHNDRILGDTEKDIMANIESIVKVWFIEALK